LALALGQAPAALATMPPERLEITGGGLKQPLEITDVDVLKLFNPWTGLFVDWSQDPGREPPVELPRYEVRFYVRTAKGGERLAYVVRYVAGLEGQAGGVYLPGPGQQWYETNIRTIARRGRDGKWHRGSEAWQPVLERLILADIRH
jgi:hypothetical protein